VGVYEVQLTSEPRVILTSPRRVLDGPKLGIDPFVGVEFTADAKGMLVMQSQGGDRPSAIGVIENWFAEFKDRR
jgi:hypothetical protein